MTDQAKAITTRRIPSAFSERRRLVSEVLVDGLCVARMREVFLAEFIAKCIRKMGSVPGGVISRLLLLADKNTVVHVRRRYGEKNAIVAFTTWSLSSNNDAFGLKIGPKDCFEWQSLVQGDADYPQGTGV